MEKGAEVKSEKEEGGAKELEILDACATFGKACLWVGDGGDVERYLNRAKEGYKEQLGRDSEKELHATFRLTLVTCSNGGERIERYRDLLKRMESALGEENALFLETLNQLGIALRQNGQDEEAVKVYERCLEGRTKVLGEDHPDTFAMLGNLGNVYNNLKNYEKALECHERALKGKEKTLGMNHPSTLATVENIAILYSEELIDYEKAEELYERVLEEYEAQLGKEHESTKTCTWNQSICLEDSGNSKRLAELEEAYPRLYEIGFVQGESEEDESDDEDEGDDEETDY